MENILHDKTKIKGWGIDADPDNEPTYPMKHYTGEDHKRLDYERSSQQPLTVEVLQSNERPGITAVFGTSVPPSGISGIIRRKAFKYSESSYGHWLPLLLADRINVIEGIIQDLKRGIIPNIFAEMGFKSEWEHNRKGVIKKVAVYAIIGTAFLVLLNRKKKSKIE